MSETWRDMDTAPRNETDVLLRRAGPPPVVGGWFERGTTTSGWYSFDNPEKPIYPVGWVPLPSLPSEPGSRGGET